jgi:Zn-dependent M28 family amino/carboxypeptidase
MNSSVSDQFDADADALRRHVEALSGFGSRFCLSDGYRRALDYAEERLQSWSYVTRRQPFEIAGDSSLLCYNLIADRPGGDGPPKDLLGAHLDSIAPGADSGGSAPGADDNGSGCALVLETARRLAEGASGDLRFVLFGAEEVGLHGSHAYVRSLLPEDRRALRSVWILDQAGLNTRPQPTLKLEGYRIRSGGLMKRAESLAESAGLLTVRTYRPYGSDHMPFLKARIPTLLLIQPDDEEDPLNHTAQDLPERLDYLYMARILRLLVRILSPG